MLNLVGPYFSEGNPHTEEYRRKGLMEGVRLLGARRPEEVREILSRSMMMVHPSLEETFGNTLIESLACGIPVVGGQTSGAVPFVLGHGDFGYLCDVSSPHDIADTMRHVAGHYGEARKKALKGREVCKSSYSPDRVADGYIRLFRETIRREHPFQHSDQNYVRQ